MGKLKAQVQSGKGTQLTQGQVRRLARPRKGWEPFVARLAALVSANPTKLQLSGVDVATMKAELAAFELAHAHALELESELAEAQGEALQHASNGWLAELRIYRFAKAYAAEDPVMLRAIAEFEAFLAKGPRKKTPSTPVTPASP
jgi:hypothetical protein